MTAETDALLAQLARVASTADENVRWRLSEQLMGLSHSIATPRQTLEWHGHSYTDTAVAKVAEDLDIFDILVQSKDPLTLEQVAAKCGADPALISRILRHLAATHKVAETGPGTFTANGTTRILASPPGKANSVFPFNYLNTSLQKLPAILKKHGYRNPDQTFEVAFQAAFNTTEQLFVFLQRDPEGINSFYPTLAGWQSPVSWATVIPWAEKLEAADPAVPIFVDVGGGYGYQCLAFRKATKGTFSGQVINEDLRETLAEAPKYDDIDTLEHSFYDEQPIKGAKVYYIRNILHDLPDDGARKVLQRIKDAMAPHSSLMIDELVVPDTGASSFTVRMDILMMTMFNSTERTLGHWRQLLGEVGLEIKQVYKYDPQIEYSIIEAALAKS